MTETRRKKRRSSPRTTPYELISFDLKRLLKSHPQHKGAIDWLCQGSVPPYMWGVMSTASMVDDLRRDGVNVDEVAGIWLSAGETAAERDGRIIEDMHGDLMRSVAFWKGKSKAESDDLLRLLFDLRPAYFHVTPRKNRPPAKYMRMRQVARPKASTGDFDELVAARDKLKAEIDAIYGEKAYVATLDNPRHERFGVFLRRDGLNVMVTLTDKEAKRREGSVYGQTYAEFASRVPTAFSGFTVDVGQWTLDKSATAGLE